MQGGSVRPSITVAEVRERLRVVMNERSLTAELVAALVRKPSGERYSRRYVEHFLLDDVAGAEYVPFAKAVLFAFPRIAAPCPTCGSIITVEIP